MSDVVFYLSLALLFGSALVAHWRWWVWRKRAKAYQRMWHRAEDSADSWAFRCRHERTARQALAGKSRRRGKRIRDLEGLLQERRTPEERIQYEQRKIRRQLARLPVEGGPLLFTEKKA